MGGDSAAMTLIMNQLQSAGAIPESYKTADSLSSDITKYGGIPTGVDSTASQSANSGTQTSSVSSGGGGGGRHIHNLTHLSRHHFLELNSLHPNKRQILQRKLSTAVTVLA